MSAKRPIILESGEQRLLEPEDKIVGHVTEQEMTQALATKLDASALSSFGDAAYKDTGTTTNTVAAGDDSRFTDSRDWVALEVSQAEAEEGTSTTPRKWTAQRVMQAISANLPEYPKITVTDTPPTSSDGEDGDIWFVI